jgi:hypothetical protein
LVLASAKPVARRVEEIARVIFKEVKDCFLRSVKSPLHDPWNLYIVSGFRTGRRCILSRLEGDSERR